MNLYPLIAETSNGNTIHIGNFETLKEAVNCAKNDDSVIDLGPNLRYYWDEIQIR